MLLTNQSSHTVVPFDMMYLELFFIYLVFCSSRPLLQMTTILFKENCNQTMIRFSGSGKCKLEKIHLLAGIPYFVMFIIMHGGLVFLSALVYSRE